MHIGRQAFLTIIAIVTLAGAGDIPDWRFPIRPPQGQDTRRVLLTPIGAFGVERKARPGIPAHLHTGVDIRRPMANYVDEPVFAASRGVVVSVRTDGPFAQVIVVHHDRAQGNVWTVYEHFGDVRVHAGDSVSPARPIGRFFTREELDAYGWQFDHIHFEVMLKPPPVARPTRDLPERHYSTWALTCYTREQLAERMADPLAFVRSRQTVRGSGPR